MARETEVQILETGKQGLDVLTLKLSKPSDFQALPGQYVMLKLKVGASEQAKTFSIASSPMANYLQFATKNTGSDFKKAWAALKVGDTVKISRALGAFVLDENTKNICLLSGGIGITPLMSMLRHAVDKKLNNKITLMYGNKVPEDIPFKDELLSMEHANPNIKIVLTITRPEESKQQWQGKIGRIEKSMINEYIKDAMHTVFYICGPPGMVAAMQSTLKTMNVPEMNIKVEQFIGYK